MLMITTLETFILEHRSIWNIFKIPSFYFGLVFIRNCWKYILYPEPIGDSKSFIV